jgi:hypothetical protein
MLSGKLGELFPSDVDISRIISQVNFTAVRTLSQIGEIWGVWWRANSPIFSPILPCTDRVLLLMYSMTHNLNTIVLAWGLGWSLVQMTAGHRPSLYFSLVKKRLLFIEPEHMAELSYIISYVANKAIASCNTVCSH